jgi:hypothetical protein
MFSRPRLYAAGRLTASVIATTSSPTHSVLSANVRNCVSANRNETCSNVGARLKMNGLFSAL